MKKMWKECARRMHENHITPGLRNTYNTLFMMREELRDTQAEGISLEQTTMWMCLNVTIQSIEANGSIYASS